MKLAHTDVYGSSLRNCQTLEATSRCPLVDEQKETVVCKTPDSRNNLVKRKNKAGGTMLPGFKLYFILGDDCFRFDNQKQK